MSYGGNIQSYGNMTQVQPNPRTEVGYGSVLDGVEGLLRTADRTPDKIASNLGMSLLAYAFPFLRENLENNELNELGRTDIGKLFMEAGENVGSRGADLGNPRYLY